MKLRNLIEYSTKTGYQNPPQLQYWAYELHQWINVPTVKEKHTETPDYNEYGDRV